MVRLLDCHRHFGGSLSPAFIWSIIRRNRLFYLAESYHEVVAAMAFSADEPRDFHRFLDKFRILDRIHWTEELIDESVKCVCDGLEAERVDYAWIRLSIAKYMEHIKWHRKDAVKFVADCFRAHAPGRVGLVLSLKYEEARAGQRQQAALLRHQEVSESIIGIDLVGNENWFDAGFYAAILKEWKDAGKLLFAHVGESRSAKNILAAIRDVGVTEVCHGIRALGEGEQLAKEITAIAKELDICFHMAITSNLLTGVVPVDTIHPIVDFYKAGLKVTLGTDDPVQCSTTLCGEYDLLLHNFVRAGYAVPEILKAVRTIKLEALNRAQRFLKR